MRVRRKPSATGIDADPGMFVLEQWLGDVSDEPNAWQTKAERQQSRRARAYINYLGHGAGLVPGCPRPGGSPWRGA